MSRRPSRRPRILAPAALLAIVCPLAACSRGSNSPSSDARTVAPGSASADAASRRLFLIGLDAADERLIAAGIAAGRLPSFARMVKEGTWGPLETHRPILSPILWTTMATGLTPDRHGVLDFVESDRHGRVVPITSASVRAPAFWDILGRTGVTCGIVGWLATYPAEKVHGFMVTDRFTVHPFENDPDADRAASPSKGVPRPGDAGKTYPPELYASLEDSIVDPSSIGNEEIESVYGVAPAAAGEEGNEGHELRVIESAARTYTEVALRMDARSRPRLLAVYFEAIDRLMHLFGGAMPPPLAGVPRAFSERYGGVIDSFYAAMDRRLGRFLDEAGPGATVIVVSDHGFKIGDERPRHTPLRSDVFAAEWHRNPGVILAWGGGVRRGKRISAADIYDVTPTILAYFGAPAAESMRGRALTDLFEPGFLPPSPPRVASYVEEPLEAEDVATVQPNASSGTRDERAAGGGRRDAQAAGSPAPGEPAVGVRSAAGAEDRAILENLRALGYVGSGPGQSLRASANLATFYLDEKRYDRAIPLYREVLEKDPGDLTALYNLGYAYKEAGSSAAAAECFERLLRQRPDYTEARLVLSDCYVSLGRAGDALALLQPHEKASRTDPGFQNHLGTVLASAGRLEEAAAALERAIALRPSEASPYLNLSRVLAARGDRPAAVRALERAHRAVPDDPRVAQRLQEMQGLRGSR